MTFRSAPTTTVEVDMAHRYCILFAALVALAVMFAPSTSAATDTPAIGLGSSGHAKQVVVVTAGPSGLPNGFAIWWMDHAAWAANGYQWPTTPGPDLGYALFTGEPTLNTWGVYTTFRLGPNESITIEIGDLADESGVSGTLNELEYGVEYYFCAFGLDAGGYQDGSLSITLDAYTTLNTNCTFTQGYWKNHKELWPVLSLTLGTVVYTQQELCDILDEPVAGNGLISLAHQLIAAKLNIAYGADPSAAAAAIAAADAQIGGLVIPPVGAGYIHPSLTSATTQTLDDFNNGVIGPGHCGVVAAEPKSWGSLKSLYSE
jgi:hypothetical protein